MDASANLEAQAQAGTPSAQFALARSLLSHPRATASHFRKAIEMVQAASAAGLGEATELCALLEATGAGRPPSWERAFDVLELAAEQGSINAGQQLALLSRLSTESEAPPTASSDWAAIRKGISVERLLHHPERRALSENPRIRIIEGFASPAECRWLIERSQSLLQPAVIFDAEGRQTADPGRSNRGGAFQLTDMDLVIEVIRSRISAATRIPIPVFEPTQVLHYSVGQEFKPHRDYLEPNNLHHQAQMRSHGQRIATFLIYLNEDFEGGETEFPQAGVRYRGKTGDAIFWANVDMEGRPDPMTLHAGLPPTIGEKWLLSQWIRDRVPPVG